MIVVQTKVVPGEVRAVVWFWTYVDSRAKRIYWQTERIRGVTNDFWVLCLYITPNHFTTVRAFLLSLPPLHLCYFAGKKCGTQRISPSYSVFTLRDLEPKFCVCNTWYNFILCWFRPTHIVKYEHFLITLKNCSSTPPFLFLSWFFSQSNISHNTYFTYISCLLPVSPTRI